MSPASTETGARVRPPPGMATDSQPLSGSKGFAAVGNACGAMGVAVGAGNAEAAGDAEEATWNLVGVAGSAPARTGCGSGEVAVFRATMAGVGVAECSAEPLGSSILRVPPT